MPSASYPEYNFGSGVIVDPSVPQVNPMLQALRNKQQQVADQYRQNIPKFSDQLYGQAEAQGRQQLKSNLGDVRKEFNRRGLLHSGGEMSGEAAQRSSMASTLLDKRKSINDALYSRGNDLDNAVFQTDLGIAGNAPGLGTSSLTGLSTDIGNEISNLDMSQKVSGGIGQGVGGGVGSYLAARRSNSVYNDY